MRRLPLAAAVLALAAGLAAAAPAGAAPAAAGHRANALYFEFVYDDQNSTGLFGCGIQDQGAGQQYQDTGCPGDTPGTDFQLINEETINGHRTWEFAAWDLSGCMNVSSSTGVFKNSCVYGDTTEMWEQPAGTHYWLNLHTSHYLNVDCNMQIGPCGPVVAVSPSLPWATPGS
jgi:hypothetical protein